MIAREPETRVLGA